MNILHVCTEFFPLLKTGGLADVTGSLTKLQNNLGYDARVIIPGFPAIKAGIDNVDTICEIETFAGSVTLRFGYYNNVGMYIIDAPHLYNRPGSPYHDDHFNSYSDNYLRFALLSWIASELACGMDNFWQPEIVHCHDWHTGLTCAYLVAKKPYHQAKSIFTIHNAFYQGCFTSDIMPQLQLPLSFYQPQGIEFHGQISYLKAGIFYADQITTVSPTYAKEITTPEFGYGMEELLAERSLQNRVKGILNGIDGTVWDPITDTSITDHYNKRNLKPKQKNKFILQTEFNLTIDTQRPLFSVVSRLTDQKGIDLILAVLPHILNRNGQFVLLGSGDEALQNAFLAFTHHQSYQQQLGIYCGHNEALSHRIIAGADIIMVPSRFEPCGLTQLYALKYGTLPLVRCTGGLADTIIDSSVENIKNKTATGFSFMDCNEASLLSSVDRAFELWQQPEAWHLVQQNAMSQNFSWQNSAEEYLELYQRS